jgi:hypothetical protein
MVVIVGENKMAYRRRSFRGRRRSFRRGRSRRRYAKQRNQPRTFRSIGFRM